MDHLTGRPDRVAGTHPLHGPGRQGRVMASQANTTARGYGHRHQTEKRRLNPTIEQYGAICCAKICLMPSRHIPPGTRPWQWHLGHNEDRTAWTGPEHPKCNLTEGAVRGNHQRSQRRRWSRIW